MHQWRQNNLYSEATDHRQEHNKESIDTTKAGKIIFRITQQKPTDKKKQTIIN